MNFGKLKEIALETTHRDDLTHRFGEWINQSLRDLYERVESPVYQRAQVDLQMSTGSPVVQLPADFKQLTQSNPVHIIDPTQPNAVNTLPCAVVTFEKGYAINSSGLTVGYPAQVSVFVSWDNGRASLNLLAGVELNSVTTFRVSYFRLFPDLVDDSDTNQFLSDYPELVETRVKARAFRAVNDYEELRQAELDVAQMVRSINARHTYRASKGRSRRMGVVG